MKDENTPALEPSVTLPGDAHDVTVQQLGDKIKAALAQAVSMLTEQAPEAIASFADKYAPLLAKYAIRANAADTSDERRAASRTLRALRLSALQDASILGVRLEQEMIQRFWAILDTAAVFAGLAL